MNTRTPEALARDILTRGLAVVGLLGIALIHLLDAIPTFSELPYKGWLYVALIVGSLAAASLLVRRASRAVWAGAAALAAGAALAFVYSRTVGLPGAADDVGNWAEPLGVAALFVEAAVLAVSSYALHLGSRVAAHAGHQRERGRPQAA
ncbi:MAG TPA: hypothetical protein VG165_13075 [Solirubrobacteraceae bacterium]|jgi:hypothetical protein|nr:hypothetical protein [Solirubrobacteraceae bacterium]